MRSQIHHSKSHGHKGVIPGGVLILMRIFFPAVIILWIIFFMAAKSPASAASPAKSLRGTKEDGQGETPSSPAAAQSKITAATIRRRIITLDHAVIVAGHAVVRLNKLDVADKEDGAWYLLPYQLDQGFPSIISSHITKGSDIAKKDESSVLIFSGGQTRRDVGPLSEAASYYYVAQQRKWIKPIANRVFLEEYARDSFENLLFSICRFKEAVGSYPTKVTVIGFDFKGKRFTELHREAIGFPMGNFTYVGLRPQHPKFSHSRAAQGEEAVMKSFKNDMYGRLDPNLYGKRDLRNPFKRTVPYELACPEMKELFDWRGPQLISRDLLPWGANSTDVVEGVPVSAEKSLL